MARDSVELGDGLVARVRVPETTITALQVPTTTAAARVVERPNVTTTMPTDPLLTPRPVTAPTPPASGGPGTGEPLVYVQAHPLLTWRWNHPYGRKPSVVVYQGLGDDAEVVESDLTLTSATVVVEWAVPTVGSVELT